MATYSVRMEQTPQRNVGPSKTEATKKWSAVAAKGSKASQSASNSERIYTETRKTAPESGVKDNTKDTGNVNTTSSTSNKRFINASNPGRVNNPSRTSSSNSKTWKTDAAISSQRGQTQHRERELLPWRPDPQDASASLMSLEESVDQTGGGAEWDQFAANEKLFGVQSHFDEEQYTSSINRNHPKYKERAQEADRIAKEIESSATDNVHLAEERGLKPDDSGLDEDDLYSGVQRSVQPAGRPNNRGPSSRENYSQGKGREYRPRNAGPRNGLLPNDPAIVSQRHMAFSRGGDSRAAEKFFNARRKMGTLSKGEKEGQIKEFMQFSQSLNLGGFGNKEDLTKGNKDVSKEKQKPSDSETMKANVSDDTTKQKEDAPSKDEPSVEKTDKAPTATKESDKEEKTQQKQEEEPKPETSLESSKTQEKPVNKEPSKPLKLNAKAASFKPNIGASVFTPGKFVLPPKAGTSQPLNPQKSSSTETGTASNGGTPGDNTERPFFPNGAPQAESSVMDNFNVIKTAGQEKIGETLEKPFSCPPTWASGPNNVQHIVSNQKVETDAAQGKRNSAVGGQIPGLVLPNGPVSPAMPVYPAPGFPYVPFGYPVPGYPPYMRAPSQQTSVAASPNATPTSGTSSAVASPMFMAPPVMPPYGVPPFQPQSNSPRGVAPATYYVPQMGAMGGMPMMPYPATGVPPMYGQYAMNNGMMNMRYPAYTDYRRSSSQRSFNPSRGNRHQNNGYKNDNYTNNPNNSNDGNNATNQNQDSNAATATDSQDPKSSEVVEPAIAPVNSDEKTS
ncbi:ataxin-2 [Schizosaccharomyces octosporus yFS286]|uniref:Ataxin-2 n=1 Tax=Schizosaccharomyces octosporus (strain yFS286) TaxID=483514 RepID=S9PSU7_SCHOY|nr:ataxin-2 [Schizosaccharomyces octosporus yFS286]EPX72221.1 ataxin-2 [Schizosaccharomyces octosporus yFS286]